MKVLIIKTSSMGDVIHTLPALTDAGKAIPGITFDWLVEENFAEIPRWHPLVNKVIPVAWRRWRKKIFSAATRAEWKDFFINLRANQYDLVIDAQGLVKSAFFSRLAKGRKVGYGWRSARESLASLLYRRKYTVARGQHAITRTRQLFSQALGYALPDTIPDYGIDRQRFVANAAAEPYLVFLHATTWDTKHWPEIYWMELAQRANQAGYCVKLPWGNPAEHERAQRIAASCERSEVLPRLDLMGVARVLAGAKAIVAVDTGLGHLSAALAVPTVSLYGPTNPVLSGALGKSQVHLSAVFTCAPCLSKECTYQGDSPLNDSSSLKLLSPLKSASPLYPPCFISLGPLTVWGALSTLL
jgi:heptosyltransferase-1